MTTAPASTASAATIIVALTLLPPPTVSMIPFTVKSQIVPVPKTRTLWPSTDSNGDLKPVNVAQVTSIAAIRNVTQYDEPDRLTTAREKLLGELRRLGLLTANWDGEGSSAPDISSLKEAVSFVRLLTESDALPEPMLHATGHAGLFWKNSSLYADIKFLGGGRVAYYIERQGDKHKGVLNFDSKKMPAVFPALLQA